MTTIHIRGAKSPNVQRLFIWSVLKFLNINMPDVTASYGMYIDFTRVFWEFSHIIDDHHSCLKCCTFTRLSLNVFLMNINILTWSNVRCDCRLCKAIWFHFVFRELFSLRLSYMKTCILTKLLKIVCPISTHILICRHVRFDYKLWVMGGFPFKLDFFGKFHVWNVISASNFHKFYGCQKITTRYGRLETKHMLSYIWKHQSSLLYDILLVL